MSYRLNHRVTLDYKRCYDLYVKERKSIYNIPYILAEEDGVVNSKTRAPVSPQAIWRASWLYALEHLGEAKADMEAIFRQQGKILREDEWCIEIVAKARQFYKGKNYRNYIEQHSYLKQYAQN